MTDDRGGLMPTQYSLRGRGTKLTGASWCPVTVLQHVLHYCASGRVRGTSLECFDSLAQSPTNQLLG